MSKPMPANKMPEMPEAVSGVMVNAEGRPVLLDRGDNYRDEIVSRRGLQPLYTAAQMRAMYLAGIADARACVPEGRNDGDADGKYDWGRTDGFNSCRNLTLTNLTALEQGAKR